MDKAERDRSLSRYNDRKRVQEMLVARQGSTSSPVRRGTESIPAVKKVVPAMRRPSKTVPIAIPAVTNEVQNIAPNPTDTTWFLCTHKNLPAPSSAEVLIIEELEKYNIEWHREVSFRGLQFTTFSFPRYDFYLPSLRLVIEYDGVSSHSNELQIATDKAKDKFCNDNGITIVRYNRKHYYNMYGHINALMKGAGIKKKPAKPENR